LRGAQRGWNTLNRQATEASRDRIAGLLAERDPGTIQELANRMLAAQPTRDARQEMIRRLIAQGVLGAGTGVASGQDNPLRITVTPRR
jgi:hypothetical protein